ncbi:MAG TPA: phospholipase D-like domain-containing protein, partial [Acidimicrobiia bacterium]|nr:phospholipase D-like domain-containing protein [Acidimicrobiia bacterium]
MDLTGAITNADGETMVKYLRAGLESSKQIDAFVGYFYFSGFQEIADEVKDKKVRILVGMGIDREIVRTMSRDEKKNIDSYPARRSRGSIRIRNERKEYIEGLAEVFNNSEIFDSAKEEQAFEIFLDKVRDGSLEIRMTLQKNHSKVYVLHFEDSVQIPGLSRGITIVGSSNLTYSGLLGQGERNRVQPESRYYDEDSAFFEKVWNESE